LLLLVSGPLSRVCIKRERIYVPNFGSKTQGVEWPTLLVIALCYAAWVSCVVWVAAVSPLIAAIALPFILSLHSSLQHEAIHGHPTRWKALNAVMVFLPLGLAIPYCRFRDTHLAHHIDERLTDPYDDPETNFMDPKVWDISPSWLKRILNFNNTLMGRMLVGPGLAVVHMLQADIASIKAGSRVILVGWMLHCVLATLVIGFVVTLGSIPIWTYAICAYFGLSLLKVRTYLEHRAHDKSGSRSVVVEDRGIFSFLFLNNNFHCVHHKHPGVAWYNLPAKYFANRERFLAGNDGYSYPSYRHIFIAHFFKAKDQVPHPLWVKEDA
jgi:fatty acid desaturase